MLLFSFFFCQCKCSFYFCFFTFFFSFFVVADNRIKSWNLSKIFSLVNWFYIILFFHTKKIHRNERKRVWVNRNEQSTRTMQIEISFFRELSESLLFFHYFVHYFICEKGNNKKYEYREASKMWKAAKNLRICNFAELDWKKQNNLEHDWKTSCISFGQIERVDLKQMTLKRENRSLELLKCL